MHTSLRHLENDVILQNTDRIAVHDRETTEQMLAHLAEVDRRGLYRDVGYSSMFHYCMGRLGFSDDMACMRMRAARIARRFPTVYAAVADGRLNVSVLSLLARPLRELRARDAMSLLVEAEGKSKRDVRILVAGRFPKPDWAPQVRVLTLATPEPATSSPGLERVEKAAVPEGDGGDREAASTPEPSPTTALVEPERPTCVPLSPARFGMKLTISAETEEKLRRAQELLGSTVAYGDLAMVLDRALDSLIEKIEKRRYGKTDSPRQARPSKNDAHIPAAVRREVHERDGGRCTFESATGHRCEKRDDLQHDHIRPKACGGKSTVANLRLRCHAHNPLAAERAFGAEFMQEKRRAVRAARTNGTGPSAPA